MVDASCPQWAALQATVSLPTHCLECCLAARAGGGAAGRLRGAHDQPRLPAIGGRHGGGKPIHGDPPLVLCGSAAPAPGCLLVWLRSSVAYHPACPAPPCPALPGPSLQPPPCKPVGKMGGLEGAYATMGSTMGGSADEANEVGWRWAGGRLTVHAYVCLLSGTHGQLCAILYMLGCLTALCLPLLATAGGHLL